MKAKHVYSVRVFFLIGALWDGTLPCAGACRSSLKIWLDHFFFFFVERKIWLDIDKDLHTLALLIPSKS